MLYSNFSFPYFREICLPCELLTQLSDRCWKIIVTYTSIGKLYLWNETKNEYVILTSQTSASRKMWMLSVFNWIQLITNKLPFQLMTMIKVFERWTLTAFNIDDSYRCLVLLRLYVQSSKPGLVYKKERLIFFYRTSEWKIVNGMLMQTRASCHTLIRLKWTCSFPTI